MSDKFTVDLQNRLSAFVENVSNETLSKAFTKANFEGYRHLRKEEDKQDAAYIKWAKRDAEFRPLREILNDPS